MSNEQNHLSDEKSGWELFRKGLRQAAVYIFVIFVTVLFIFILFKWTAIKNAFGVLMRILAPVIFGLVIAYILMPVVNFIQRKLSELSFFKKWTEKSYHRHTLYKYYCSDGICSTEHLWRRECFGAS